MTPMQEQVLRAQRVFKTLIIVPLAIGRGFVGFPVSKRLEKFLHL